MIGFGTTADLLLTSGSANFQDTNITTTGTGTFGVLDFGEVAIIHKDGTQTRYNASADTDVARGTALVTAVTAAVDGDTIYLSAHTFDMQDNIIDTSIGGTGAFNVRGAGKYATVIKSSSYISGAGSKGMIIEPAEDGEVSDLSIVSTADVGKYAAGWGRSGSADSIANAVLRNVYISSDADGVYFIGTSAVESTISLINVTILTKFDVIFWRSTTAAESLNIYDSHLETDGTSTLSVNATVVKNKYGTINIYNSELYAHDADTTNTGVSSSWTTTQGAVVNVYGGTITTSGTGAVDLTTGTGCFIGITTNTVYDPTKTSGTGTILYLDTPQIAVNFLKLDGSNANTTIDIGSENFVTTGTLGAGATTVTSLDAGSGLIQTTGDVQIGDDLLFPNANSVINFGSGDILQTYTSGLLTQTGGGTYINYSNTAAFKVGSSAFTVDTTNTKVGIGTTNLAAGRLRVVNYRNNANNSEVTTYLRDTDGNYTTFKVLTYLELTGNDANARNPIGMYNLVKTLDDYDYTNYVARSLQFVVEHNSTGTIGNMAGAFGIIQVTKAGTITNSRAFISYLTLANSGGSIGTHKHYEISASNIYTGGGTVGTEYGFYVGSLGGTTKWGVYDTSGADWYQEGKITLGQTDKTIGIYSQADSFMDFFADGGVRIGDSSAGAPTNYTHFEANGFIEANGTAVAYKDINMAGYLLTKPAASAPGVDTFRSTGGTDTTIETYAFAVDEKVHGGFELQHDYKEGTDLVFHVHWQGIAAPSGTDNVQWRINYIVARDGVTLAAATVIDSPDTAINTQYRSYRTDFAAITGTDFKIEDQFMFTLTRVAATGDAYLGDALIETTGIHYKVNTIGSRAITTK